MLKEEWPLVEKTQTITLFVKVGHSRFHKGGKVGKVVLVKNKQDFE